MKIKLWDKTRTKVLIGLLIILAIVAGLFFWFNKGLFLSWAESTNQINAQTARDVAEQWLAENPAPMVKEPGDKSWKTTGVRPFKGEKSEVLAYIVDLNPEGYIIVPAYESIEPILFFSTQGSFKGQIGNTEEELLADMLAVDIPDRLNKTNKNTKEFKTKIAGQWKKLKQTDVQTDATAQTTYAVTPTIAPLLQESWYQVTPYNYYTPNNYVVGCVAIATGQIMHYFRYPPAAAATNSTYYVDGVAKIGSFDSTYNYNLIPNNASTNYVTQPEIEEVAKFLYNIGVAVHMRYSATGSGATPLDAASAFTNVFGYTSATWKNNQYTDWPITLKNELNAAYPVEMAVTDTARRVSHAIVADGWGTDGTNTYYHLNLGWGYSSNGWYSVPGFTVQGYTWDLYMGQISNIRKPSTADTSPPAATITSPASGQTVSGTINVQATASDNIGVTKAEFYRNNTLVATQTAAPFSYSWNTAAGPNGTYSWVVKATDGAGNVGTSQTVSVNVNNASSSPASDTTKPTISIITPINGSIVPAKGYQTVTATAADNVAVTKVQFYINGVLSFTDTTSPYAYSWKVPAAKNKSYTLTTKAIDGAANVGVSAPITVTGR